MLQDAAARTRAKKEETSDQEGVTIMAPAITGETPSVVPFASSELGNVQVCIHVYLEQSYSLLSLLFSLAASEVALNPVLPDFSSVKVEDLFRCLVSHTHSPTQQQTLTPLSRSSNPAPFCRARYQRSPPRTAGLPHGCCASVAVRPASASPSEAHGQPKSQQWTGEAQLRSVWREGASL